MNLGSNFAFLVLFLSVFSLNQVVSFSIRTATKGQGQVSLDLCTRRLASKSPFPNSRHESHVLQAKKGSDESTGKSENSTRKARAKSSNDPSELSKQKAKKKQEMMKQLKAKLDEKKQSTKDSTKEGNKAGGLLDKLNPFQAGQSLRQTLGTLTTLGTGLDEETKQKYYLDDRFLESSGGVLSEKNPYLERIENNYVPEVLVIGATGEVGRLVVRRLLLEGQCRVRVLVKDLYSQTLNLLGTGVTYCQGDLGNVESLEYALTDVDKIVFCAAAPRPDEPDFQEKFQYFLKENLETNSNEEFNNEGDKVDSDFEWEQLSSVLELRAQLAEQIDFVGMQNLVRAYQNVRHADYGTSQAAKRSLFKFTSRMEDFNLFTLDDDTISLLGSMGDDSEDDDDDDDGDNARLDAMAYNDFSNYEEEDDDEYSDYFEEYDIDDEYDTNTLDDVESRRDATVKSQIKWIRNEFGNGVFVGKVPAADATGVGGEAGIVSSRLRSREDPENGIDLSAGFAGFIVRLLGDGGNYEAFIRTGAFEKTGIEYVCEFSTSTKQTSKESKSRNKFTTVRLPFENFKPVLRNEISEGQTVPPFQGSDVRYMGFRFRSASNARKSRQQTGDNISFYIALSYVKVYRLQPEPEFVYLSDARIPPVIHSNMVRHRQRKLLVNSNTKDDENSEVIELLDENTLKESSTLERSAEETYFKFRGEEVLKGSGLSYTIVRVSGYNEIPSGEASTIDLSGSNEDVSPVSRAEAAQVCVSALMDPSAMNKSVYMGKRKSNVRNEDLSEKFASVPADKTS